MIEETTVKRDLKHLFPESTVGGEYRWNIAYFVGSRAQSNQAHIDNVRILTEVNLAAQAERQQSSHTERLRQTLEGANVQLDSVITDIVGKNGRAMILRSAVSIPSERQSSEKAWCSVG